MKLFVDSAAHLALLNRDDQHHAAAVAQLESLREARLVTSRFVLAEVLNRAVRDVGAKAATTYARGVLDRDSYSVLPAMEDVFDQALDLVVRYEDQALSFVDCTSIVIMRSSRIRTIFTFDRAFRRLGFEVVP
jgi:predicted nucleic acid-binding protein